MSWIQWVAIAVVCALGALALAAVPLLSALLAFAAVACLLAPILMRRRRDKYDLGTLKEFHEREKEGPLPDVGSVHDADTVTCPHCFEIYDANSGVCRNCGRSPAS